MHFFSAFQTSSQEMTNGLTQFLPSMCPCINPTSPWGSLKMAVLHFLVLSALQCLSSLLPQNNFLSLSSSTTPPPDLASYFHNLP